MKKKSWADTTTQTNHSSSNSTSHMILTPAPLNSLPATDGYSVTDLSFSASMSFSLMLVLTQRKHVVSGRVSRMNSTKEQEWTHSSVLQTGAVSGFHVLEFQCPADWSCVWVSCSSSSVLQTGAVSGFHVLVPVSCRLELCLEFQCPADWSCVWVSCSSSSVLQTGAVSG
ncbi:hypothetical protein WMY93_033373, partial [Mugilogobius chulae]